MRYNIFKLYNSALKRYPLRTNAISTGALFGIGDLSAQLLLPDEKADRNSYDYVRTLRAVTYGSMIFSVIGDRWYKILNDKIVIRNLSKMGNTILRVSADQILFAPFGLLLYFSSLSVMEGKDMDALKSKLQGQWWSTLKTNWIVWPFFQFVNFSIVPVYYRLLSVNIISIMWNTYLSYKNSLEIVE